jgi:hypothetical protein
VSILADRGGVIGDPVPDVQATYPIAFGFNAQKLAILYMGPQITAGEITVIMLHNGSIVHTLEMNSLLAPNTPRISTFIEPFFPGDTIAIVVGGTLDLNPAKIAVTVMVGGTGL